MMEPVSILIVGAGGREHALAWKISQSPRVRQVFVAPGNAGTAGDAVNVPIADTDKPALIQFAQENQIDLVVVAACVSGMLNRVHPDVVRSHWSGQGDVLDAVASVTDLVENRVVGSFRSVVDRVLGERLP